MRRPPRLPALALPAFLLGFAASGFFDGILLHQILRWHHLLSAIRTGDVAFQILADGYFHLVMYAVAAIGLWILWRRRAALGRPDAARRFASAGLIGFGSWHLLDAVGSHWVLGIHRIRGDADQPLLWDLGWLALFGLVPMAVGWFLRRGGPSSGLPRATLAVTCALIVGAAGWSAQPPRGQAFTTVVFSPATAPADALAAVMARSDALVWSDGRGVFVVAGLSRPAALRLYGRGALLVSGAGATPGCFSWTRP